MRKVAGLVTVLVAGVAGAQNYPVRPVRVVIPWPPGGANDIVGRIVAQRLSEQSGQQFVIDNRGGANGTIGTELVAKAPADGYTLLVTSAAHVTSPHLYKKLPYDTLKDFTGVTSLAVQVGMLVVHPSLPAKTVKEFVALGRAQPGKIVYASSGAGSFVHLAMALINAMTNTEMVHVPFKGGAPAVVALASGEVQAMTATIGSVIPHLSSNRIRVLGVTSAARLKSFPNIPTIAEGGVPGYEFSAWIGSFLASGTPKPIVEKLNGDIKKVLDVAEVAKIMGSQTLDPMHMSAEQFDKRLKSDYDKYEKLVKLTGVKAN